MVSVREVFIHDLLMTFNLFINFIVLFLIVLQFTREELQDKHLYFHWVKTFLLCLYS